MITSHDVLEPLEQALLASRDVIICSQIAARTRRGFFTLGDGCWLPNHFLEFSSAFREFLNSQNCSESTPEHLPEILEWHLHSQIGVTSCPLTKTCVYCVFTLRARTSKARFLFLHTGLWSAGLRDPKSCDIAMPSPRYPISRAIMHRLKSSVFRKLPFL